MTETGFASPEIVSGSLARDDLGCQPFGLTVR